MEPWLDEDFIYHSQWVIEPVEGKAAYLDYFEGKYATIKRTGARVWAQFGTFRGRDCVVLAQGSPDELVATVLIDMKGPKIRKINLCGIPDPHDCAPRGEYPVDS